MRGSIRKSRRGLSTTVSSVLMVLIVISLSAMIYVWAGGAFSQNLTQDNTRLRYLESFNTLDGGFVFGAKVGFEEVRTSPTPWTPNKLCTSSSPLNAPYTGNVLVPTFGECIISATVSGNVYASPGATLTINNTRITGTLNGNFSSQVTIVNSQINGDLGLYSVSVVIISGSSVSGNLYAGNRGLATMTSSTVQGDAEFEVNRVTTVIGNTVRGQLEAEDDETAQVTGNSVGSLDTDENGAVVVTSNRVSGNLNYGQSSWCAAVDNTAGTISGRCVGQVEIDVLNSGSIPVSLRSIYIDRIPSTSVTWSIGPGDTLQCGSVVQSTPCNQLPIVIPVGKTARVTLVYTPPSSGLTIPGMDIYISMVSSHGNFVDGHLYFVSGLSMTSRSRPVTGVCPPCN